MSLPKNDNVIPFPSLRPRFNISDAILIKNALQIVKPELIPELQQRCDLIIQELLRAEQYAKRGQ